MSHLPIFRIANDESVKGLLVDNFGLFFHKR